MTIAGYAAEKAAIAALFSTGMALSPAVQVAWPGKAFKTPNSDTVSWVDFNIINGEASQISIGSNGSNVHRFPGIVSIMIYTPPNLGEDAALALADRIIAIYANVTSVADIMFGPGFINKMGVVGNYIQISVSIPFNRDTLK